MLNSLSSYFPFFHNPVCQFSEIASLAEIEEKITSSNYSLKELKTNAKKIKELINKSTNEEIESFFKKILKWGISTDIQKIKEFLISILDKDKFFSFIDSKNAHTHNAIEWAKLLAQGLPHEITLKEKITLELKKFRPQIIYFIPNVLDIFLDIFKFLDNHKRFGSLWEKYLILEIVCKFILLPYLLIQALQPILQATFTVYATAIGAIFGFGLLLAVYQRWFKPIPNEIVHCKNLEKLQDSGLINKKMGQIEPLCQLISALMAGSNILIVGRSGEGKTTLIHHLIQWKNEGKLPEILAKLKYFSLHCGDLMGHGTFGHAEMIGQTKDKIEGYEKNLLIFFDEIDQLVTKDTCFQTFKQKFLNEDEPHPQFVAATTPKGLEKIVKQDEDGSFMQRVVLIVLDPADDNQCRLVIEEYLQREANGIPVTGEGIQKIIELSKSEVYLPQIGRLVKIKKILEGSLGRCRWTYSPQYIPMEITKNFENDKKLINKIKQILLAKEQLEKNHRTMTFCLAKGNNNFESHKQFLLHEVFLRNMMDKILQEAIDEVKETFDVQIDEFLVQKVFDNYCEQQKKAGIVNE